MKQNQKLAYVLGHRTSRPLRSNDLLCAADDMAEENLELSLQCFIIDSIRFAPSMTASQIVQFCTDLELHMLPSAKEEET